jgi:hypothetical protein
MKRYTGFWLGKVFGKQPLVRSRHRWDDLYEKKVLIMLIGMILLLVLLQWIKHRSYNVLNIKLRRGKQERKIEFW